MDGERDGRTGGGRDVRQALSLCRQVEGRPHGLAGAVQEQCAGPHVKSHFFGCLWRDSGGWEGQGGWWEP